MKVIAAISEELFDRQPEAYRNSVLPPEATTTPWWWRRRPEYGACGNLRNTRVRFDGRRIRFTSDGANWKWLTGEAGDDVICRVRTLSHGFDASRGFSASLRVIPRPAHCRSNALTSV